MVAPPRFPRPSTRQEQGIILPLAAVVLLGVTTLLFAAGIDSLLVRTTRSRLQDTAQRVCQGISHDMIAPDTAVDGFRVGIESAATGLSGASLREASLILALPNEATLDAIDPAYLCTPDDALTPADPVAATPAGGVVAGYFKRDFNIEKCSVPGLEDCTLWAYPNERLPPGVPEEARYSLLPGRGIGCALAAEVHGTPFQAFMNAEATRPVVRAQAIYSTVHNWRNRINRVFEPRGLRIAISTQLPTPALQLTPLTPAPGPNYKFNVETLPLSFGATRRLAGSSAESLDTFIHLHDPLCAPPNPLTPSAPWCPQYRSEDPFKAPSLEHTRAFSGPKPIETYPYSGGDYMRGGLALSESQRMELMISCINPPVLIRNIIAATLVGLAARDPVLRRHTEILHINPLQVVARKDRLVSLSAAQTPSTIMVPMGADITSRSYQLPLLEIRQDHLFGAPESTLVLRGLGDLTENEPHVSAGAMSPLNGSGAPYRASDEVIHSELADQLRRCLHLYSALEDGGSGQGRFRGLDAVNVPSLTESPYGLLSANGERGAFSYQRLLYQGSGSTLTMEEHGRYGGIAESSEGRLSYDLDPILFPPPPEPTPRPQAQPQGNETPWNSIPGTMNARRLTAMELVSVLGSSQRCPYSDMRGSNSPGDPVWCPSEELAAVDQLTKERIYKGYTPPGRTTLEGLGLQPDYRSLIDPLISPLTSSPSQADWYERARVPPVPVFGQSHLRPATVKCRHAGLVVLTHSLGNIVSPTIGLPEMQDPPQLSLNERVFESFRADPDKDGSPLVLVVIPTISNLPRVHLLKSYLYSSTEASADPDVHILMLAPPGCVDSDEDTRCTDADSHSYWAEVLDPQSPSYVEHVARDFFSSIINQGAPKRVL